MKRGGNREPPRTAAEIVADVEARIGSGELAPGDRLEPVRGLADRIGVAANTVAAAYRILGERGLVVGEGRRGTIVVPRPPLGPGLDVGVPAGIVDLASGNPDPALLPELGSALAEIPTEPVLYGGPAMNEALVDLFTVDLGGDGIDTTNLCIVGGALDGIERILAAHCRPGDRIGIEDPGYASIAELATAIALRPVPVAVDEFGPQPDSVAVAVERGIAAIVVTPRAGNPSGAALDDERGQELRALLASASSVLVIEDDHAGRIAGQPYVSVIPDGAERWAMVRSVAKSLGPDLRVAALAGDAATVARVVGRQSLGAGWVSHVLQSLVAQLLADPDLDRILADAAASYAERRSTVIDVLRASGAKPQGRSGLNVWVPVDDEAAAVAGMLRRGYAIRSGSRFRIESGPGVRVSIGGSDLATLRESAEVLGSILTPRRGARSV